MADLPVTLAQPLRDLGAAPYDRHAKVYDRLIGAPLYNRLIWRARVRDYAAFAAEAVADGDGPLLDAGCGTAVFSAEAYRNATRPLVLADRSRGMLDRARERIGRDGDGVWLVQADLFALPFAPGAFATVACHAVLHVLDDPWPALDALAAQVAPGGGLFVSMLVADGGGVSGRYLQMLHGRGEAGAPRTSAELAAAARERLGERAAVERSGAMAYLRWRSTPE
jgi:SAM-dependent methyltransferase